MNMDRGICSGPRVHFPRLNGPHAFLGFKSAQHPQGTALSTLHPKMSTLYDRCLKQQVKPGPGALQDVPEHLLSLLSLVCHGKPLLRRGEKQGCSQWLAAPQICWYIKPARLHTFPSCLPENSTQRGRAACCGWAGRRIQPARQTKLVAEYEKLFAFFFFFPPCPAPPQHSELSPLSSLHSQIVPRQLPARCCGDCHHVLGLLLAWVFSGCEKSRSSTRTRGCLSGKLFCAVLQQRDFPLSYEVTRVARATKQGFESIYECWN